MKGQRRSNLIISIYPNGHCFHHWPSFLLRSFHPGIPSNPPPHPPPYSALILARRWGRRRDRRRTAAVLFRLRHAFPHRLLEGPVRLRSSDRLPERMGLFHRLHRHYRPAHSHHRRPGVSLWLHHWPQGLGHSCGFCGSGNICSRWVLFIPVHTCTNSTCLWCKCLCKIKCICHQF